MSLRWPVVSSETSACSVTVPSAARRSTRRSFIETTSRSPSGSHPRPDGWASTSSTSLLVAVGVVGEDRRTGRSRRPTSGRRASAGTRSSGRPRTGVSARGSCRHRRARRLHEHLELTAGVGPARLEDDLGHAVVGEPREPLADLVGACRSSSPRRGSGGRPRPRPPGRPC